MRERELIAEILTLLNIHNEDAFVFPWDNTLFSLTIDTLVAQTDVPEGMTPFQIGWKAVVMNLSDLAAMGSLPRYFLCSVTAPVKYPVLEIVNGVQAACTAYHTDYVGGDLNQGHVCVSGVALGTSSSVMLRSGAQPGDKVGITGDVGRVYAGFKDLKTATASMKEKIFSPTPRIEEGCRANANSCIDISDGLSSELHTIAKASHVRIDVYSDRIPIHHDVTAKACNRGESPVDWALKSGEEYELVVTNPDITMIQIGDVHTGKGVFLDGEPLPLAGWEHVF
jgi:thiamine-monophosphate kinase